MTKLNRFSWLLIFCFAVAPSQALADDPLELERYAGKVVVVDFWASWCVPCRRSFPWMNEMQAKHGDKGLVIIAVNVDKKCDNADKFLQEFPAKFVIHYDSEAAIAKEFGVEAMPSSFVFGRDGKLITRHLGFKIKKRDEYESVLINALEATQ